MRQAAVALIEQNGLFLSVSRKNDPNIRGFAGGQVDPNETVEQAMVRELFEETGLIALSYREFYKDDDGYDFETTCFLVSQYDGQAYSKEAGVVEWVPKEKLEEGPFAWFNKKVFIKYTHTCCQSHCCSDCKQCKYSHDDCPVVLGKIIGDHKCENCEQDDLVNADLKCNVVYLASDTQQLIKDHFEAGPHFKDKNNLIRYALANLPLEKEVFCNCCGLTCKLKDEDASGNYGLINASVDGNYASTPGNGGGALDDCTKYTFSLCEFCCDWLFKECKVPPLVSDYTDGTSEKFISASDRVTSSEFRSMKERFFAEKYKRDVARGK